MQSEDLGQLADHDLLVRDRQHGVIVDRLVPLIAPSHASSTQRWRLFLTCDAVALQESSR